MKPMRVNKYLMPVLVIALLLGTVWGAKALGVWQTSGRGEVMLDASGQPDPEGIKGWMTLAGLSESYGIPLDALYTLIGAGPDVSAETELKELEAVVPGFSVSTLRVGVAAYLDGSWTPEMGAFDGTSAEPSEPLPSPMAELPVATPTPLPATPEPVPTAHTPQGQGLGQGSGTGEGPALPQDGSRLPAAEIRGRMTLQDVVTYCQVPLDYLIAELGLPAEVNTRLALRDVAAQYGSEVSIMRDVVERYQAEH